MTPTGRFTPKLRKLVHYSYDTCTNCGHKLPRDVAAYSPWFEGVASTTLKKFDYDVPVEKSALSAEPFF